MFEPVGVKLDIRSEPYTRSVGLAQRAEVDACVGSYHEEFSDLLYPRWNFDTDHVYALGLASNPAPTLETLGNYRLAWVRGYDYQSYLPNVRSFNEVIRRTGILSMLTHNRADYYIDALTEINYVLSRARDPSQFRTTHVAELPLYLCFANTPNPHVGRGLTGAWINGEERRAETISRVEQPYTFSAGAAESPVGAAARWIFDLDLKAGSKDRSLVSLDSSYRVCVVG